MWIRNGLSTELVVAPKVLKLRHQEGWTRDVGVIPGPGRRGVDKEQRPCLHGELPEGWRRGNVCHASSLYSTTRPPKTRSKQSKRPRLITGVRAFYAALRVVDKVRLSIQSASSIGSKRRTEPILIAGMRPADDIA
jgi:hypothetical protein